MPVQRRMSTQDESLLTPNSGYYRKLPSIALASDGIPLKGTLLLMIVVRMHAVGLRGKERFVLDCSLSDSI